MPQQGNGLGTIFSKDRVKTWGLVTGQYYLEELPRWKGTATISRSRSVLQTGTAQEEFNVSHKCEPHMQF